ncbi:gas vesicle protein [Micromonospora sp. DR5-3]|uniref:gas vesicle protein GvpJ n=1 Tax=unclassified Micromonospora TaxID=2617518 RepID=UPI0011D77842|nr:MULTISPECIES: gas vesicle protein GvpJ [unclassified Micromonospora]MCW3819415.1 gas vesicle protein [Micromonospora sp. DR5-3]TYC20797.1 gas vesicle protein [Micromonospora sp. MP36]
MTGDQVAPRSRYAQPASDSLADVLERVLDRGVVIVGDIVVGVLDIELLTLKVRLLVASVDTARQMGIDWWLHDPFLNSQAAQVETDRKVATSAGQREEIDADQAGEKGDQARPTSPTAVGSGRDGGDGSIEQLRAENEALRERLAEIERRMGSGAAG